ncbi:MAG TPA: 5-oxoprolinase subunit PxpB [Azospirillaceae bacterium]|nr:5-oxoprolinase subunit PxpB [Azospirillaceae bacterium]
MSSPLANPRFLPAGDTAVVVEFGDAIDQRLNSRVLAFDARLARADIPGINETIPTYRSLLVVYDPEVTGQGELVTRLQAALDDESDMAETVGRRWTLPVVYGGPFGEDLSAVAVHHGLSEGEVIDRHATGDYRVYMIGFQPGFAYLGGLDPSLETPRRADPRPKVPAGSIAIGGGQTAVFSVEGPSGWHLLGRTPVRVFDLARVSPFLLAAGDRVRLRPVPADAWEPLVRRVEAGDILAEEEPRS